MEKDTSKDVVESKTLTAQADVEEIDMGAEILGNVKNCDSNRDSARSEDGESEEG